jgi:hypothetical protein
MKGEGGAHLIDDVDVAAPGAWGSFVSNSIEPMFLVSKRENVVYKLEVGVH